MVVMYMSCTQNALIILDNHDIADLKSNVKTVYSH